MIERFHYYCRIRKLLNDKRRIDAHYRPLVAQALAQRKPHEEIEELLSGECSETEITNADLYHLQTQRWIQLADYYGVPTPEWKTEDDPWVLSPVTGQRHLTIDALAALRAAVRKEQREQSENYLRWIGALTGIIGALIGLVSLVLKK